MTSMKDGKFLRGKIGRAEEREMKRERERESERERERESVCVFF